MDQQIIKSYLEGIFFSKKTNINLNFENNYSIQELLSLLISKKILKTRTSSETVAFISTYITNSFEKKAPLKFNLLFGGYKLWGLPNAPHVSWAEVFHLDYISDFLGKLSSLYPFGVEFIYRSDSPVISFIDNYPFEEVKTYEDEFTGLINIFNKRNNYERGKLVYQTNLEQYSWEDLIKEINQLIPAERTAFANLSVQDREVLINKARKNYYWKGFDGLSEDAKRALSAEAYVKDVSYIKADLLLAEEHFNNSISVIFRKGNLGNCLHFGTTKSSTVQFWVGEGVLELRKGRLVPHVFSTAQLHNRSDMAEVFLENLNVPDVLPNKVFTLALI